MIAKSSLKKMFSKLFFEIKLSSLSIIEKLVLKEIL